MPCFRKIPAAPKPMDKKGVPSFSVGKFLSHNVEVFRRGTILYCVAEMFRKRKRLWMRGVSRFSVELFLSQSA